jgi:hypothetical protein
VFWVGFLEMLVVQTLTRQGLSRKTFVSARASS